MLTRVLHLGPFVVCLSVCMFVCLFVWLCVRAHNAKTVSPIDVKGSVLEGVGRGSVLVNIGLVLTSKRSIM